MTDEPKDQAQPEPVEAPEPFRQYVEIVEQCVCGSLIDLDMPSEMARLADRKHRDWSKKHEHCVPTWRDRFAIGDTV